MSPFWLPCSICPHPVVPMMKSGAWERLRYGRPRRHGGLCRPGMNLLFHLQIAASGTVPEQSLLKGKIQGRRLGWQAVQPWDLGTANLPSWKESSIAYVSVNMWWCCLVISPSVLGYSVLVGCGCHGTALCRERLGCQIVEYYPRDSA